MKRLVVGCMTGTSLDGIDAALVEVAGRGLAMKARFVRHVHLPLGACAKVLRALAGGEAVTAAAIAEASHKFALKHAGAVRRAAGAAEPDLVSVHGQTVIHRPPLSWQLMQPAPIAAAVGAPVVFDLRAADLAAGGQGAPLTPLSDLLLFGGRKPRAVVNLGGFCNVTLLPGAGVRGRGRVIDQVEGFDVCACNLLLDEVARVRLGKEFDAGGRAAARGTPDPGAARELLKKLAGQRRVGRSLGTGDEVRGWVAASKGVLSPEDCAATAVYGVATVIAAACAGCGEVVLAGGGVRNRTLAEALRRALEPARVMTTDDLGVPAEAREAAGWAVLGALAADGEPVSLARVTGVRSAPRAGAFVFPP